MSNIINDGKMYAKIKGKGSKIILRAVKHSVIRKKLD